MPDLSTASQAQAAGITPDLDLMQLPAPEPVSMWPATIAWQIVFIAIVIAFLMFFWKKYQVYKKSHWKRQALAKALEAKQQTSTDTWFTLIKRVHLTFCSREGLSKLNDEQVIGALTTLNDHARSELLKGHYKKAFQITEETNEALYQAFIVWVNSLTIDKTFSNANDSKEAKNV